MLKTTNFHLNKGYSADIPNVLYTNHIFMRKSAMQMHARELQRPPEVNKPHQCQQCLKSFSSNHQLVQHIRVHTGEKPYKCSYCERRFKQLSHVQQHTRLHTEIYRDKVSVQDINRISSANDDGIEDEEEELNGDEDEDEEGTLSLRTIT
ncbi:hypothetical protein O3M35_008198 [Rhynocoris fuscipes]|uniref:C2H2-type domain-containing protein n=1 Tax=Rhynocoris fuscipes TaxID=488301 RepID=A0AAW1D5D8_9HEMI